MPINDLYGWFPSQQPIQQDRRLTTPEQAPNAINPALDSPPPPPGMMPMPLVPNMQGGAYTQQAHDLLARAPHTQPFGGAQGINGPLPTMGGTGDAGAVNSNDQARGKIGGAASGATAGYQIAGPWGALAGGVLGYGLNGGAKDLNPIDASGFSGIGMDQARQNGNLARLGSNPGAALASYAGIKSNSDIGRALDPTAFLGGLFRSSHGDEKRNLNAFTKQYQVTDAGNGMLALPDGTKLSKDQLQSLAGAWYGATYHPDGNQEDWQSRYDELLGQLYSQPMYNDFPGG